MAEASSSASSRMDNVDLPTRPDRSGYNRVKRKYRALQLKYSDIQRDRSELKKEHVAAEAKITKLNEEINLILDQLESGYSGDIELPEDPRAEERPRTQSQKRPREEQEESEATSAKDSQDKQHSNTDPQVGEAKRRRLDGPEEASIEAAATPSMGGEPHS